MDPALSWLRDQVISGRGGMDLLISLTDESEVAELAAWLRNDPSFGPVTVVQDPPTPGTLHGPPPQIQVAVASTPALTSVAVTITAWLRMQRASVQLTIEGPSGQRVILTAASPDDAVELSRILAAPGSQQRDEPIATPDGHTPPGPPLDPDDDWPQEAPER
ncbi:effector-associated constant component EACC1 [Streptomyces puniciscabiei]